MRSREKKMPPKSRVSSAGTDGRSVGSSFCSVRMCASRLSLPRERERVIFYARRSHSGLQTTTTTTNETRDYRARLAPRLLLALAIKRLNHLSLAYFAFFFLAFPFDSFFFSDRNARGGAKPKKK